MKYDTRSQKEHDDVFIRKMDFMLKKDFQKVMKYMIGACACSFVLGFSIACWILT